MKTQNPIIVFVGILIFMSLACNLPGQTASVEDQVAQTVQAQIVAQTAAAIFGTEQITPTTVLNPQVTPEADQTALPAEPTITPQPSLTPSITPTSTPMVPMVSVSTDTNCRLGPHVVYDYLGALMVDETAEIIGKQSENPSWVLINNPDREGTCWISTIYATIQGNLDDVPLAETPPFYDWNGTFTAWGGPAATEFVMVLTQNGVNISGTITNIGTYTVEGTLSENGQLFTGRMYNDTEEAFIILRMMENMNQAQGSLSESPFTVDMCAARNGAGKPNPCGLP